MAKKLNLIQKVLRIEPGISLGQWIYDILANNWQIYIAFFVGGGATTYLAAITEWTAAFGPLGVGGVGLIGSAIVFVGISLAQLLRSRAREFEALAVAADKWKEDVSTVNPLAAEFHTKRIRISDLAHPVKHVIEHKRFIDCELVGPANLVFTGSEKHSAEFNGVNFGNCDVVVLSRGEIKIQNVIELRAPKVIGGSFWNMTLFIHPDFLPIFSGMGANVISMTGNPALDVPGNTE